MCAISVGSTIVLSMSNDLGKSKDITWIGLWLADDLHKTCKRDFLTLVSDTIKEHNAVLAKHLGKSIVSLLVQIGGVILC